MPEKLAPDKFSSLKTHIMWCWGMSQTRDLNSSSTKKDICTLSAWLASWLVGQQTTKLLLLLPQSIPIHVKFQVRQIMYLHCNSSKDPWCTLLARRVPMPKRIMRENPRKRRTRDRREKWRKFKETCAGHWTRGVRWLLNSTFLTPVNMAFCLGRSSLNSLTQRFFKLSRRIYWLCPSGWRPGDEPGQSVVEMERFWHRDMGMNPVGCWAWEILTSSWC